MHDFIIPLLLTALCYPNPYFTLHSPQTLKPHSQTLLPKRGHRYKHYMHQNFKMYTIYHFPRAMLLPLGEKYGIDIYTTTWEFPPEIEGLLKKLLHERQRSPSLVDPEMYVSRPQAWIEQEQRYRYIYQLENRKTYRNRD